MDVSFLCNFCLIFAVEIYNIVFSFQAGNCRILLVINCTQGWQEFVMNIWPVFDGMHYIAEPNSDVSYLEWRVKNYAPDGV